MVKSIEEHASGINQMIKISEKELVSVSDDCTLKFWNASQMKVEMSISTETITCIVNTGPRKDVLVAGCHSGNFITCRTDRRSKKDTVPLAHPNLVRVLVSLNQLNHRYFASADVCGVVKVWYAEMRPQCVLQF